jgi:hypothetical protein
MKIHRKKFLKLIKNSLKDDIEKWNISITHDGYAVLKNYEIDAEIRIDNFFLNSILCEGGVKIIVISTRFKLSKSFIDKMCIYILVKFYFSKVIKKQIKDKIEESDMISVDVPKSYTRIKKN